MLPKEEPEQWSLLHDIFYGYYSASFFSKPSSCSNGSCTKWWGRWRLCIDLATEAFAHQNSSGYSHCWVPSLQKQRSTLSSRYGTISWGDPPATWWHLDYIRPPLSWFVIGIDTYSRLGFAFATHNASWKNTICGLTECCIKHHSRPHCIVSKELIL